MKAILLTVIGTLVLSANAQAWCDSSQAEVNNDYFYANVLAPSHLALDFVLVKKQDDNGRLRSFVTSTNSVASLPSCEVVQKQGTEIHSRTYEDNSGSLSGLTKAYKVCTFDSFNKVVNSLVVCNSITGD